jgi:hypothetical protein
MNWDAMGAIGELVGSAAVVITLAYLAIQTKNNNKASRSNSTNQSRAALTEVMGIIASDSEAMAVYYTGMTDPDSLDAPQRLRFDTFVFMQLRATEAMFWEHRDTMLANELWEAQWRGQQRVLLTEGGRGSWLRQQNLVSTLFKDWVNDKLE